MKVTEISGDRLGQTCGLDILGGGWDRLYVISGHVKAPDDIFDLETAVLKIRKLDGETTTPELLITSVFKDEDRLEIAGWEESKDGFHPIPFMIDIKDGKPVYTMIQAHKETLK